MEFSKKVRQASYTFTLNEIEACSLRWLLERLTKEAKNSGMYPIAATIIEKLPAGRG